MANSKVTQHTVNEDDKRFFSQEEQEEIAKHHNVETPNIEHPENDEQYAGLQVNAGIEQMPIVNPYMKRRKRKPQLTVNDYVEGILKGNTTVLGQAVTLVESLNHDHQVIAQEVIEKCLPHTGQSRRIGITGVPGAGKSTSIDVFGLHVLQDENAKLAVLAIDPSSERSNGSILGDKTRMEKLSVHPRAFIRPSPSAGSLGGVARKTRETIVLCEAAGYNNIFVETVGVGQSETAVHSMVDFFLLIQLAGTGDELQGIKRGIMEMADGLIINKADGDNKAKAVGAQAQYRAALKLFPKNECQWDVPVEVCSALEGYAIDKVWKMILQYEALTKGNGYFEKNRTEQNVNIFYNWINFTLQNDFYNDETKAREIERLLPLIREKRISPYMAASQLAQK